MKVTRVFADEHGETHFEDREVTLQDAGLIGRLSEPIPAKAVVPRENDPGYDSWADTSTLFVRIYHGEWDPNGDPGSGQALADGDRAAQETGERFLGERQLEDDDALVVRDPKLAVTAVIDISVGGFVRELLTFEGTGNTRRARLANIMRYGGGFAEGLMKAYGGAPLSDGCASFPRDYQRAPWSVGRLPAIDTIGIKAREPAFRRATIGAVGVLLVAVKVRPHRAAAGQFFNRWSVALDFGKRRARRQAELLGEDVENAREANKRRVFSNCSGRKFAEIKFAFFLRRRHHAHLTTKTRSDEKH